MRILTIGSGGREHALCRALAASPLVDALYCAPGGDGIALEAETVAIGVDDVAGLVAWARDAAVDFVVPGPEAPLAAGLADAMEAAGVPCLGPSARAARLEASKSFMKEVADAAGVPTAAWRRFDDARAARAFVAERGAPVVVKADGLAAGKGVTVAATVDEARAAIDRALVAGAFGAAGASVVIEEFLEGEEASFHALTDGRRALPLATARDYKRAGDGDTGPNTGGMGCVSPAPAVDAATEAAILDTVVRPTLAEMARRGRPFRGVLYAGLMLTAEGPKLLEYNARFGDPECQALTVRLESDLLPALLATRDGALGDVDLRWRSAAALCVVMATRGYPGPCPKDTPIAGLEEAAAAPDVAVFHAGARRRAGGGWLATGGRALGVTALGATVARARERAYAAVDRIDWPQGYCRRDIGLEPRPSQSG